MKWLEKKNETHRTLTAADLKIPSSVLQKKKKKIFHKRNRLSFTFLRKPVGFIMVIAFLAIPIFLFGANNIRKFLFNNTYISPLPLGNLFEGDDKYFEKETREAFKKYSIAYENIEVDESLIRVTVKKNSYVYLSTGNNINNQIASLQFILSRLTMEGRDFKSLDLRFENPVIVLKE